MKKLMISLTALASALVLLFPGVATADTGRAVPVTFEFYAIGHGDLGGVCFNQPTDPPELAPFGSCAEAVPLATEDHVGVTVVDSASQPVYFSVQQENNPNFAWGCGTLQGGDLSADGLFPINGTGAGGTEAPPVVVFPWAGPGVNTVLDPGGTACVPGSVDADIVNPGTTGTATITFHDHVA